MSKEPKFQRGKQKTVTQINDNQFIIEGYCGLTKIGGETEYSIAYIDFDNGPFIHIGRDFLGRGLVSHIDLIDSDQPDYIIVKVTLKNENKS